MKRLSLLILYACFTLKLCAEGCNFVFRVDDFRLENDTLQERIIDVFKKNNIPLVIGVIPTKEHRLYESMPDTVVNKWIELINTDIVEIALHGFYHEESIAGKIGEFTGALSYEEQFSRLKRGKAFLDSVFSANGAKKEAHTFIPPWNLYDRNTILALDSLRFDIISGSRNLVPINSKLRYYPSTVEDFDDLDRISQSGSGTFIILFHSYTFNNYTIAELDKQLKTLSHNPNNKFFTISGLQKHGEPSYDGGYVGKIQSLMRYVFKDYHALNNHPKWEINMINSFLITVAFCLVLLIGLKNDKRLITILIISFVIVFVLTYTLSGSGLITDKYLVASLLLMALFIAFIRRSFKRVYCRER